MLYTVVACPEDWKAWVNAYQGEARFASMMCSTHIVTITLSFRYVHSCHLIHVHLMVGQAMNGDLTSKDNTPHSSRGSRRDAYALFISSPMDHHWDGGVCFCWHQEWYLEEERWREHKPTQNWSQAPQGALQLACNWLGILINPLMHLCQMQNVAIFSVPWSKVAPPVAVVRVKALGAGDDSVAMFEPKVNGPINTDSKDEDEDKDKD